MCTTTLSFSQEEKSDQDNSFEEVDKPKATIDQYKIYTLERDTVFADTSLTIQSEYKYNYLRKDIFGLMPFANEGQSYTRLKYSLKNKTKLNKINNF